MAKLELACCRMTNLRRACADYMLAANTERNAMIHRLEEHEKEATAWENNLSEEVSHLRAKLGSVRVKLESI